MSYLPANEQSAEAQCPLDQRNVARLGDQYNPAGAVTGMGNTEGHIFRGKRRLIKRVSLRAMETLRRDYERQEQNMLWLRHPYLTVEESAGHAKELGKTEAKIKMWNDQHTMERMKPHVTIEERLAQLKVRDAWE